MISNRFLGRPKRASLAILGCVCVFSAHSFTISIGNNSDWAIDETYFTMPTDAGGNISPDTLESGARQAKLTVKAKKKELTWKVTVERTMNSWYSPSHVYVKVTSTHTDVTCQTDYIEITSDPNNLLWSTVDATDATNVYLQFKLDGLTAFMGGSNSTAITYTVLSYN
jgi:hypothetical protein